MKAPRCGDPFVADDPRTITCDRPKGHKGKHLSRWVSFADEADKGA